jgi:hypothetical protein
MADKERLGGLMMIKSKYIVELVCYLSITVLSFINHSAQASTTIAQANAIFKKLVLSNNLHTKQLIIISKYVKLRINPKTGKYITDTCTDELSIPNVPQACTEIDNNQVYINKVFLKKFNPQITALVLAHELGHATVPTENEYRADEASKPYIIKAGFNLCEGAEFYKWLPKHFGGKGDEDRQHPPYNLRYRFFSKGCGAKRF